MGAVNVKTGLVGTVFFVRWLAQPQLRDAQDVLRQLAATRASVGTPLIFCSILTTQAGPPAADLRARMGEMVAGFRLHCAAVHLVLLGDGLGRSLLRTVVRGALVAARQSGLVTIHDGVEDVLRAHPTGLGMDPAVLLENARRQGLVD